MLKQLQTTILICISKKGSHMNIKNSFSTALEEIKSIRQKHKTNQNLPEQDKLEALSSYFDVPFINLDYLSISKNFEELFDIELLQKYEFIPKINKTKCQIIKYTD